VLADDGEAAGKIELHDTLEAIPHNFFQVEHKHVSEGLSHFIGLHKVDMLVMVEHQRGFFDQVFRSSITRQMSMLTNVPLLVLHEH